MAHLWVIGKLLGQGTSKVRLQLLCKRVQHAPQHILYNTCSLSLLI